MYVVILYRLLHSNLKFSSGKLSHFSDIWWALGALMFLLKPKGQGRGRGATWSSFTVNILRHTIGQQSSQDGTWISRVLWCTGKISLAIPVIFTIW
jgi:hypothetical protein